MLRNWRPQEGEQKMEYLIELAADWQETWKAVHLALIGGGLIGLIFGVAAERSDFCTRSAIAAALDGSWKSNPVSIFTLAVAMLSGLVLLHLAIASGLDVVEDSPSAEPSLRVGGIVIGSVIFGMGMALCRSCISRLIVLTGRGNIRSLISLVFMGLVSWMSISGVLAHLRLNIAGLGAMEDFSNNTGTIKLVFGIVLVAGLAYLWRRLPAGGKVRLITWPVLIGALVPLSFIATGIFGGDPFDPVPVEGLRFIQPVADSLAFLAYAEALPLRFGLGIAGGALVGAAVSAALAGRSQLQGFDGAPHPLRYLIGAALMGFGGVTSGGCTIAWLVTNTSAGHLGVLLAGAGFVAGMWIINHGPIPGKADLQKV